MELNEQEIKVLSSIFQNQIELEHIHNNNLYEYQLLALQKLRGLMSYLLEKYQTSSIEVIRYELANSDTNADFFSLTIDQSVEHYHAIFTEDHQYLDDLYGYFIEKDYDQMIINQLSIPYIVGIKTFFKTLYHEKIDLSLAIAHQKKPIRDTEIFINQKLIDINEIKIPLLKNDIKGNYRIYCSELFDQTLSIDDYWKIWKENMENIQIESFRIL